MRPVDQEIQNILQDKTAFPASIAPAVASYLHDLVLEVKPTLSVEVGCFRGFSTLHIGKALQSIQGARLISFDLELKKAAERIYRAGLDDVVEFVSGDSAIEGMRYFGNSVSCLDFLFIDGDHTRRGCIRDAEVFLPLLKDDGILILHDIYPERCGWLGPRYLIECLKKACDVNGNLRFSVNEISDLDQYGIAVCRKQGELSKGFLMRGLVDYKSSRLAQFVENAHFEGKKTPWEMLRWGTRWGINKLLNKLLKT